MRRRLSISVLFLAGLFAVAAAGGQAPPGGDKAPETKKPLGEKVKQADPADNALAAALTNDPDVKIAKAKVQLAEAEVAKAKQAVVLKVLTLQATIKEYKSAVTAAQVRVAHVENLHKNNVVSDGEVVLERTKLESAQAALARAETELKLLTGGGSGLVGIADPDDTARATALAELAALSGAHKPFPEDSNAAVTARALAYLLAAREAHPIKGPIPDRIHAALDKPVKLGDSKGEVVPIEKALEVFKKDAKLDVAVSLRYQLNFVPIQTTGEELPVGAWFQMFADANPDYAIVVRDYGLLVTIRKEAPPEAPTIAEFWKQKPAAKKEIAPEPKGK